MGDSVAQELVNQGRAGMRGLMIISAFLLWLMIEPSPQPISTARSLADSLLIISDRTQDPLVALDDHFRKPLSQYRFEFKDLGIDSGLWADKEKALEHIPVRAILDLGKHALIDAPEGSQLAEIFEAGLRNRLGELESQFSASGLSDYSTLGALEDEIANRIQLPIIEQSVSGKSLLTVFAIAIICLNGYLTSICSTACKLAPENEPAIFRSWLPLHLHSFGLTMSVLAVMLPSCLWTIERVLAPLLATTKDLTLASVMISLILFISGGLTVKELLKLRATIEATLNGKTSLDRELKIAA